jgi:hypothetical protein
MTDKTTIQRIKELDQERATLFEHVKQGALRQANEAVENLNALGLKYRLVEGDSVMSRFLLNIEKRSASTAMRWIAAAMQEAKGFRRLKDHKQLPALRAALDANQDKTHMAFLLAKPTPHNVNHDNDRVPDSGSLAGEALARSTDHVPGPWSAIPTLSH